MDTYLFYDLETSGLNKCFDQVVQFAAVRTDLDLNELERYEFFVKLNSDVVPSPGAFLTHKIPLAKLADGKCEYEVIKAIHSLFNTPSTVSIGYNNLGFDDEFLRFSFYRNLLDPYAHQYANGCYRMDIYPMVVIYYLFKPKLLKWADINGANSFRLEYLSAANNLMAGFAHDAMNDVLATIKLARLLKQDEKTWDYLALAFNKKVDLNRLEKMGFSSLDYQEALLVDGSCGKNRAYQSQVIGLGLHRHYKNQSLWLPIDQFDLSGINKDNLTKETFVYRKRFGEPPLLLPPNKRFSGYLSKERLELADLNRAWLKTNQQLFLDLVAYYLDYKYPEVPDLDIDAALYQIGFMSDKDRLNCHKFHLAALQDKLNLIAGFANHNLNSQAIRILGRNYPEVLAKDSKVFAEFKRYLERVKSNEIMVNYKQERRLTKQNALEEIETLFATKALGDEEQHLLKDLTKYIQSW